MLEILLFIGLVALLVIGNVVLRVRNKKSVQLWFTVGVSLLLLLSLSFLSGAQSIYFNLISINPFSLFFIFLFTLGMILLNLIAYSRSRDYSNFAILSSFALVGMYLIAGSTSLVSIFIGLELMSIPSSFIILLSRRESLEAATKYFVMASVAIALLSFAVVLVYGSTNSLALQLPQQQPSTLMSFAFILFVAALGFEASLFPFNVLLPDVYQGSSAYATAMLGGLNKKAGFAALLQIFILIFITFHFAFIAIALLSVLTMFYGNLGALVQENFKRMLAYSSISQAGYILMGIAVADQAGIGASLVQIFAHVFLFIGIMGIVAWLESRERNEINDLIGLYKENRLCAIALTFFMLALAGVPFTTGFVGKFLIFLSAVSAGLVWLALLGIINSIISVFYYAKAITAIYTNKLGAYRMRLDRPTLIVVLVCAALTLLFGIYPQPLIQMTSNAAGYLFASI